MEDVVVTKVTDAHGSLVETRAHDVWSDIMWHACQWAGLPATDESSAAYVHVAAQDVAVGSRQVRLPIGTISLGRGDDLVQMTDGDYVATLRHRFYDVRDDTAVIEHVHIKGLVASTLPDGGMASVIEAACAYLSQDEEMNSLVQSYVAAVSGTVRIDERFLPRRSAVHSTVSFAEAFKVGEHVGQTNPRPSEKPSKRPKHAHPTWEAAVAEEDVTGDSEASEVTETSSKDPWWKMPSVTYEMYPTRAMLVNILSRVSEKLPDEMPDEDIQPEEQVVGQEVVEETVQVDPEVVAAVMGESAAVEEVAVDETPDEEEVSAYEGEGAEGPDAGEDVEPDVMPEDEMPAPETDDVTGDEAGDEGYEDPEFAGFDEEAMMEDYEPQDVGYDGPSYDEQGEPWEPEFDDDPHDE